MGVLSPRTGTRGLQRIPVSVPGLRRTSELKACILGPSKPRRLAAMVNKTEQLIPRLPPFWGWQLVQLRCTARSVGPLYGE